jgi:hypothetical protein
LVLRMQACGCCPDRPDAVAVGVVATTGAPYSQPEDFGGAAGRAAKCSRRDRTAAGLIWVVLPAEMWCLLGRSFVVVDSARLRVA